MNINPEDYEDYGGLPTGLTYTKKEGLQIQGQNSTLTINVNDLDPQKADIFLFDHEDNTHEFNKDLYDEGSAGLPEGMHYSQETGL